MNKLYNKREEISSNLQNFFTEINLPISKYRYELLSELIICATKAESAVIADITNKSFSYDEIQDESLQRKIRRLFKSKSFKPYEIYDSFIKYIIKNYKIKHLEHIHIAIDHMFCNDKFVTLMFTLRVGKQGIPMWFRSYKGQNNPDAFKNDLIIEGINYVYNLFKDFNCEIIFLADRWFPNAKIFKHVEDIKCTYVFRIKKEHKIKIYDKKLDKCVWKPLADFSHKKCDSKILENIDYIESNPIKTNIILGKTSGTDEPWLLATNGNPKTAVRDYSHRFGAIECLFKNQKSNGFYIESTKIKNIESFRGMYLIVCMATVWLVTLGADYAKNKSHYRKKLAIRDTKKNKNGKVIRIISLFNVGLTLFNKLFEKTIDMRLKCNFMLYDI